MRSPLRQTEKTGHHFETCFDLKLASLLIIRHVFGLGQAEMILGAG